MRVPGLRITYGLSADRALRLHQGHCGPTERSPPRNLGPGINTQFIDQRTTLSRDGKRFYVGTNNDLYVSDRK